ncbi:glycosyltransferase family 4 protein, partial [Hortaea werneckii]
DLVTYSNVMLQMHRYFETCDFIKTWNSEQVWRAWLEAWLVDCEDLNVLSLRECFAIEHPSLSDFRDALNLYICYFFIYSVELPTDCPTVFQTTHHGLSSLYGMILKHRKGVTWGLWDHAILWRETCLNISPAQCLLPLPVQSMLIAGIKLACHLAYTHVDIVLPCTSVFNPDWEQDLGTDQGLRGSKKAFARKIDPIVNGISNMDTFQPITETRSKLPTTVMLSNVQFIKDVKTAVRAADVIINKYGFKDYRLVIYGAQDRQPSYALETVNLINSRGMAGKVILAGFGSPKEVLKDAWLFLNSSLSEGLPLAIGEAALSGVPIVATEVGATALVLTDPDDIKKRYGEVVPPNDPESLARAQLSVLAMMGSWAQHTRSGESAPLPDTFSAEDVERITK